MILTNQSTSASLTLHDDLLWTDEHSWSETVSSTSRSVTGALLLQTGTLQAGRPITLEPPNESMAWMDRSVVDALRTWTNQPGLVMSLQMDGKTYQVMFRHEDTALEARPVKGFVSPQPNDPFLATIRLMEI